jgi:hypothetical protein
MSLVGQQLPGTVLVIVDDDAKPSRRATVRAVVRDRTVGPYDVSRYGRCSRHFGILLGRRLLGGFSNALHQLVILFIVEQSERSLSIPMDPASREQLDDCPLHAGLAGINEARDGQLRWNEPTEIVKQP